ncbi:anti-repressor SinI family protein [Bacillus songklensis]|uniref:Anti-repressor SinI family protein n=1 Tax=Bacillus songklensis TaxID=1069116 RepID=A0ABV8B4C0_9BACI
MSQEKEIDQEWLELMVEAKKLGLSIQEVRHFMTSHQLPIYKKEDTASA